jgi:hypothetical protein
MNNIWVICVLALVSDSMKNLELVLVISQYSRLVQRNLMTHRLVVTMFLPRNIGQKASKFW